MMGMSAVCVSIIIAVTQAVVAGMQQRYGSLKCSIEHGLEESKAMCKAGGGWTRAPATLTLLLANLTSPTFQLMYLNLYISCFG